MKILLLLLFVFFAWGISGCRSPHAKEMKFQTIDRAEEGREVALTAGAKMLRAIQTDDYPSFVEPMEPSVRKKFTKQVFDQFRKRLLEEKGKVVKSEFVTDLKQEVLAAYVWKVTSSKPRSTPGESKGQTANIHIDWLFRLVVAKLDGKYVVFGFGL